MRPRCRPRRATHAPPNPASRRGLIEALRVLEAGEPTPADVLAQERRALELTPYRRRQCELPLCLPERED